MKQLKTDQRSRFTQMTVKKTLLTLTNDKPLNKITVIELCAAAGINRITFYKHFHDIYDVFETIENDFYEEIIVKLKHLTAYNVEKSLIREIIQIVYRNADLCNLVITTNFLTRVMNTFRAKFTHEMSEHHKSVPLKTLDALYRFQVSGTLGLITDWIKNGMTESPEELANLIEAFTRFSLDGTVRQYKC